MTCGAVCCVRVWSVWVLCSLVAGAGCLPHERANTIGSEAGVGRTGCSVLREAQSREEEAQGAESAVAAYHRVPDQEVDATDWQACTALPRTHTPQRSHGTAAGTDYLALPVAQHVAQPVAQPVPQCFYPSSFITAPKRTRVCVCACVRVCVCVVLHCTARLMPSCTMRAFRLRAPYVSCPCVALQGVAVQSHVYAELQPVPAPAGGRRVPVSLVCCPQINHRLSRLKRRPRLVRRLCRPDISPFKPHFLFYEVVSVIR